MSFLDFLFKNKAEESPEKLKISEEYLLNESLRIIPGSIPKELSKEYTRLNKETLDRYDSICKAIYSASIKFILRRIDEINQERKGLDKAELKNELTVFLHKENPWINEDNIGHLYSMGLYCSYK
ncbi:MAG TPA: hypothetical protein VGE24_07360 [Emticicia sp.]